MENSDPTFDVKENKTMYDALAEWVSYIEKLSKSEPVITDEEKPNIISINCMKSNITKPFTTQFKFDFNNMRFKK